MMGFAMIEMLMLFFFGLGGQAGIPLGLPPGPEDPAMSRFAPDECLFYTSWAPTVAADPNSQNATERWMAQQELHDSFNQLKAAIHEMAMSSEDVDEQAFAEVAFTMANRCLTNAVGFYISKFEIVAGGPIVELGALIHLGDDAGDINEELTGLLKKIGAREDIEIRQVDISGASFYATTIQQPSQNIELTWGIVDDQYLAFTVGDGQMQSLLDNLKSDPPQWLADLRSEHDVPRVSAITHVDVEAFVEVLNNVGEMEGSAEQTERIIEVTGLEQLRTAGWVAGLDETAFVCHGTIKVEGEPTGMLAIFADEGLEPANLGRVADDRMILTGASLSAPRIFEMIRDISNINEFSRGEFDEGVEMMNMMLDIDIEEDIMAKLDEHAYVYGSINFTNPTAGWVLGIGASSEMELADTYSKVVEFLKESCEGNDDVQFKESTVNGNSIYTVQDTSEWNFMPDFSWAMAEGELLISMDKSSIRRHLRREPLADDAMVNDEWFASCFDPPRMDAEGPMLVASIDLSSLIQLGVPMLGTFGDDLFPSGFGYSFKDLPPVDVLADGMSPNVSALYRTPEGFTTIQRQTYPGGTPGTFAAAAVIGLMPATMTVRVEAARTSSANNIRQLVLSMHNFHDANRGLPARFSKDDEDKPLLSWRVHILPYLEESDLYNEFHLDEPWDSDHNKTLIDRMPETFKHPRLSLEDGKTVYVVPVGEGSIMKDPEAADNTVGMSLERVTDGTSRTAIIFEANEDNAVVWTQPDDFAWGDHESPVDALYDKWPNGRINVALADGSVQSLSREKLIEIFKLLVQADDGEAFDLHEDE